LKFYAGEAGKRLERDRLIKRLERLNDKKSELEKELAKVTSEIAEIEQRLEELQ
jgi:prefoldin subunit 5